MIIIPIVLNFSASLTTQICWSFTVKYSCNYYCRSSFL